MTRMRSLEIVPASTFTKAGVVRPCHLAKASSPACTLPNYPSMRPAARWCDASALRPVISTLTTSSALASTRAVLKRCVLQAWATQDLRSDTLKMRWRRSVTRSRPHASCVPERRRARDAPGHGRVVHGRPSRDAAQGRTGPGCTVQGGGSQARREQGHLRQCYQRAGGTRQGGGRPEGRGDLKRAEEAVPCAARQPGRPVPGRAPCDRRRGRTTPPITSPFV